MTMGYRCYAIRPCSASADLRPTFASGLYFQTKPSTCGLILITMIPVNILYRDSLIIVQLLTVHNNDYDPISDRDN